MGPAELGAHTFGHGGERRPVPVASTINARAVPPAATSSSRTEVTTDPMRRCRRPRRTYPPRPGGGRCPGRHPRFPVPERCNHEHRSCRRRTLAEVGHDLRAKSSRCSTVSAMGMPGGRILMLNTSWGTTATTSRIICTASAGVTTVNCPWPGVRWRCPPGSSGVPGGVVAVPVEDVRRRHGEGAFGVMRHHEGASKPLATQATRRPVRRRRARGSTARTRRV